MTPSIIIALWALQYLLFLLKAHFVNHVIMKESQLSAKQKYNFLSS